MAMTKSRRTYDGEFKREALRLLETSGKSAAQLERELGLGAGCLSRWKQKQAEEGEQAFPGHGRLTAEQERLRQLERENEILRQERDILKKAVAIFSHPSRGDSSSSRSTTRSSR
jgi:transposase